MSDLLSRTAALVDIPSTSHNESALADLFQSEMSRVAWLGVDRVDDNVVARTTFGRDRRVILAGHLDTVPPNGNVRSRVEGDRLFGLGSADMKGGLAVMAELAQHLEAPSFDLTFIFYSGEEVDQRFNGLRRLASERPDLLAGDVAILGEPTACRVEAGCQGTMRLAVTMRGARAHTARAWTGVNAVHRAVPLLERVAGYAGRRPVLDGCEYREALQVVRIEGGVANNVVPDSVKVTLNHRFAPDRTAPEARKVLEADVIADATDASMGDAVEVEDIGAPAAPGLGNPVLSALVGEVGLPPMGKLGWTDVAFFTERGVPAANFGPGDPSLAHTAGEMVTRADLEVAFRTLSAVLS